MFDIIEFTVEADHESGGYVAFWDDPRGGGITTQGDDLRELQEMVADAMRCYFDESERPQAIRMPVALR